MRDEIRDLQQKLGLTVVYVTHDQEAGVSDRIIVMNKGRMPRSAPRGLQTSDLFVANFIESNIVDCRMNGIKGDKPIALGSEVMTVDSGDIRQAPPK